MLVATNVALHASFLALWEDALIALVDLDYERARASWAAFGAAIDAHRATEESFFADWPGVEEPRGGSQELVTVEHARIGELIALGRDHLEALIAAELDAAQLRRALFSHLEPFTRVRHLLEHHGEREDRIIYPHLEAHLPAPQVGAMAARLRAAFTGPMVDVPGVARGPLSG